MHNQLNTNITPVGFKYIGEDIIKKGSDKILIGGESSGGLTVQNHIPEKDGIIADLLIVDLIAKENKPLSEILKDVKENIGINIKSFETSKVFTNESKKDEVMKNVANLFNRAVNEDNFEIGKMKIDKDATKSHMKNIKKYKESGDGFKFIFDNGSSFIIRKSGTEPKVRAYIDAFGENEKSAEETLNKLKDYINNKLLIEN